MKLDHVMYATHDLEVGMDKIEHLLGVRPEPGGSHDGAGTRNALLGLSEGVYLEVIAPDPAQSLAGTLGESIASMTEPSIRTWAISVNGYDELSRQAALAGLNVSVKEMSRRRPDGVLLEWRMMFLSGHTLGAKMPFFIDWLQSPHPSESLSNTTSYQGFSVGLNTNPELANILTQLGLANYLGANGSDGFELLLEGALGKVTLR